jgi:hypothetical protein
MRRTGGRSVVGPVAGLLLSHPINGRQQRILKIRPIEITGIYGNVRYLFSKIDGEIDLCMSPQLSPSEWL